MAREVENEEAAPDERAPPSLSLAPGNPGAVREPAQRMVMPCANVTSRSPQQRKRWRDKKKVPHRYLGAVRRSFLSATVRNSHKSREGAHRRRWKRVPALSPAEIAKKWRKG
jgi:hypothetical protein